jgi:hypothetical protein
VLRAAGVASREAIGDARLHDLSRSHALTFAELPDGTAYVVKCLSRDAHAAGRSLAAELYAYRLATWRRELAAVLPRCVHLDERHQVIALVAAPPAHLFPTQCLSPGFPSPDLAAAFGSALATVHVATTGVPLLTIASCGVVHLPDTPEADRRIGGGSAAGIAVSREVVDDAGLATALRRLAAALRPTCLIHADLKWDNAVLDAGPPARVHLFDWELSGRGDPAWDVGSVLADTVSLALRLRGVDALPADPVAWVSPALRAFLAAYAVRAGDSAAFAERVVDSWTARTIHLAMECAAALDDAEHLAVRHLLAGARRLAGRYDALIEVIDGTLATAR